MNFSAAEHFVQGLCQETAFAFRPISHCRQKTLPSRQAQSQNGRQQAPSYQGGFQPAPLFQSQRAMQPVNRRANHAATAPQTPLLNKYLSQPAESFRSQNLSQQVSLSQPNPFSQAEQVRSKPFACS